mmetsp:Transcript_21897/g.51911  ORF Transcript_21897/g.51911 Transcript_21897/m.51911 type:complete len:122 (-) Transcript_21897:46-411(-)
MVYNATISLLETKYRRTEIFQHYYTMVTMQPCRGDDYIRYTLHRIGYCNFLALVETNETFVILLLLLYRVQFKFLCDTVVTFRGTEMQKQMDNLKSKGPIHQRTSIHYQFWKLIHVMYKTN